MQHVEDQPMFRRQYEASITLQTATLPATVGGMAAGDF
jgi:hypothetical protein